ncbi:MAG: hypothetical protein GY769_02970 [bacterium]|nr:hypothetical protein [bacterium]
MAKTRFVPPVPQGLKFIGSVSEKDLEVLLKAVRGSDAYDINFKRLSDLASKLEGEPKVRTLSHAMSALEFFYFDGREWVEEGETFEEVITEFLSFTGLSEQLGDDPKEGTQRLLALLTENPTLERKRRLRWLRTGILNTAVRFASFVDLRPRFDKNRKQVEEFVPCVILQIVTETESDGENTHVIQLSKAGLTKLKRTIEDIDRKLHVLSEDQRVAGSLSETVGDPAEPGDSPTGTAAKAGA